MSKIIDSTNKPLSERSSYWTWTNMLARCNNPNRKDYKYYGGRGIAVCKEWFKFINFYNDMGDKQEGMSLDRIDNNKGYCKENCRWATRKEQLSNRRPFNKELITFNGESKLLSTWSKELKIKHSVLYTRIYNCRWPVEKAFTTAIRQKTNKKADAAIILSDIIAIPGIEKFIGNMLYNKAKTICN
jgi:hypothetical protein